MTANTAPIFSRLGAIEGGTVITALVSDYNGTGINNQFIFDAEETSGSFIQRLRFKANGTNIASVARIYVNNGSLNLSSPIGPVTGTPTGTPSTTGGTLLAGSYFARIQPVDQYGGVPNAGQSTSLSTETAAVTTTGSTGSITWNWTAVSGAAYYRIFVATVTGGQYAYFESTTNSFVQTIPVLTTGGTDARLGNPQDYIANQMFIGEVSLPATTASTTAATPDIDYLLNMALPPKFRILVGISTATPGTPLASGWSVTGIGGNY